MRPEEVTTFLRGKPFKSFRVTLTDGRSYDVVHLEKAMVGRSMVVLGFPQHSESDRNGEVGPIAGRFVNVSHHHIMQVESTETADNP